MKCVVDFTARCLLCFGVILFVNAPFYWPTAAVGAGLVLVGCLGTKKKAR